jgi:hypothetical protein
VLDRLLCFLVTGLAEQPSVCTKRKTRVLGALHSPGVKQLQHRPREAGEHRCFLTSSGPWFRTVRRLSFTEYVPINVNISPRVPTLALRIASLALGCALGMTWLSADTAPWSSSPTREGRTWAPPDSGTALPLRRTSLRLWSPERASPSLAVNELAYAGMNRASNEQCADRRKTGGRRHSILGGGLAL